MILDRQEYLRWAYSDLLSNRERGIVAEYLVGHALDAANGMRTEWDAYDIETTDGIKIEVKSAGYIQSWKQTKPSAIRYDIAPKKIWNEATNRHTTYAIRSADVYVFCLLEELDRTKANPLNTDQWSFIVLPSNQINTVLGNQKTVALSVLKSMADRSLIYTELAEAIRFTADIQSKKLES